MNWANSLICVGCLCAMCILHCSELNQRKKKQCCYRQHFLFTFWKVCLQNHFKGSANEGKITRANGGTGNIFRWREWSENNEKMWNRIFHCYFPLESSNCFICKIYPSTSSINHVKTKDENYSFLDGMRYYATGTTLSFLFLVECTNFVTFYFCDELKRK